MRAVVVREWGGPEVLEVVTDHPEPAAGAGEVLVDVELAGMNFADTHAREDVYLERYALPFVPGTEVLGTIASSAEGFEQGERVLAVTGQGGYAERVAVDARRVHRVPDGVPALQALAMPIQGLTAWHLHRTCAHLREGESVVVHGAAGGTGTLLVQLARGMGAGRVIATATDDDKLALATRLGADAGVRTDREDLAGALKAANDGRPLDVVHDAIGGAVFEASLDALGPLGRLVTYGLSSREKVRVSNARLLKTSVAVVGFWLFHVLPHPEHVDAPLADLFDRLARGELEVVEGGTYPLAEARAAQEALAGRRTQGKLALDPRA